jgi:hydroxypyruvate isomerase
MPRFAANLSMLYNEHAFVDRFAAAAADGFDAVEYLFPYAVPAADLAARLQQHGLTQALFNAPPGNFDAGERGLACLPDRVDEFRNGVGRAIAYAKQLGVGQLNCLAGKVPAGVPEPMLRATFVANLRYAAAELKAANLKLLIEPINTFDIPGFYLQRTAQAISVLDEVGAPNAYLQYDAYHMQRMEGELAATIEKHLARIAHIQIADNPGRHEPVTGEIDHGFLFRHLDRIGYAGHVGCEYKPATTTEAGLGWLQRFAL